MTKISRLTVTEQDVKRVQVDEIDSIVGVPNKKSGSLPMLEFKYFETHLFHFTAIVLLVLEMYSC
jgi:hypothetical protein